MLLLAVCTMECACLGMRRTCGLTRLLRTSNHTALCFSQKAPAAQACTDCSSSSMARYVPERTLLLAFGHDEEVGGSGARATAQLLQANGTELAWILDEGGPVLQVPRQLFVMSPQR